VRPQVQTPVPLPKKTKTKRSGRCGSSGRAAHLGEVLSSNPKTAKEKKKERKEKRKKVTIKLSTGGSHL
jgi:hypothetical protein